MDPVQSVFAEQFFPAAAILSNTYACEQNCIWWKGLGNTLTSLRSSEKEETVNQEDPVSEKEETKMEVAGCFIWHQLVSSWVLDTLAVLIVFGVRCEMNEALANMTLPFFFFFFFFPCPMMLGNLLPPDHHGSPHSEQGAPGHWGIDLWETEVVSLEILTSL